MQRLMLSFTCVMLSACAAIAQAPPAAPAPTAGKITAVTVYQTNALVTRQVAVPDGRGVVEIVVAPLPPSTVSNSLYSEGTDGVRVLSTRYRTRPVQQNIAEDLRKLEEQVKQLARDQQDLQRQVQTQELNVQLLAKLENFTSGALTQMTEKGMLNAEGVTTLAKFIMDTRAAKAREIVQMQQAIQANQEQAQFVQRQMRELAGTGDKTIREAVIVVDRTAAGNVKLNYLVTAASWRPQYKFRASKDKPDVQVEYLAAIQQQSGEDWSDVEMTLSTAQPMLNAAPPELAMLDVSVGPPGGGKGAAQRPQDEQSVRSQAGQMRQEAQFLSNRNDEINAKLRFNEAAAIEQSYEILDADAMLIARQRKSGSSVWHEGQSVTFRLNGTLTVPWRMDEQLVEVSRIDLKGDWFYKAVPVLTPHVYRLANLTNSSTQVLLPGEATMYIGTDFVGRAALPLVAIGEQFTAGFGVDPQVQVTRQLVEKTTAIQGGNKVLKFDYRIAISNYKTEAAKVQLWDRLPHSDTDAVSVTLSSVSPELSRDAAYVRDERPKNLLRWDLEAPPQTSGEKAAAITYSFKLEFDRNMEIGKFLSK